MSKRLGKDQRAAFLAEFEKEGKLSDPNYYAIKTKNGKVQIRHVKPKGEKQEQQNISDGSDSNPTPEEKPKEEKPQKEKTL